MTDMELKPCPFCGGKPMVDGPEEHVAPGIGISYSVFCSNDDCYLGRMDSPGFYQWLHEAAAAWNARAERTTRLTYEYTEAKEWRERLGLCKCGNLIEVAEFVGEGGNGGYMVVQSSPYCEMCGAKVVD